MKNKIEFYGKADTFYDSDSNRFGYSTFLVIADTMWGTATEIRKTIREGKDIKITIEEVQDE